MKYKSICFTCLIIFTWSILVSCNDKNKEPAGTHSPTEQNVSQQDDKNEVSDSFLYNILYAEIREAALNANYERALELLEKQHGLVSNETCADYIAHGIPLKIYLLIMLGRETEAASLAEAFQGLDPLFYYIGAIVNLRLGNVEQSLAQITSVVEFGELPDGEHFVALKIKLLCHAFMKKNRETYLDVIEIENWMKEKNYRDEKWNRLNETIEDVLITKFEEYDIKVSAPVLPTPQKEPENANDVYCRIFALFEIISKEKGTVVYTGYL